MGGRRASPLRKHAGSARRSGSTGARRRSTSSSSGPEWTWSSNTGSTIPQPTSRAMTRTVTGKIALAHLNEFPDYYTRLERMEEQAKRDHGIA